MNETIENLRQLRNRVIVMWTAVCDENGFIATFEDGSEQQRVHVFGLSRRARSGAAGLELLNSFEQHSGNQKNSNATLQKAPMTQG